VLNKNIDIGALVMEDCESLIKNDPESIEERMRLNLCMVYTKLFDIKRQQRLAQGEDGEILEYTKAYYSVALPPHKIVLPREKPIPKPKPLTKWERFRLEKGITAKNKRSRLTFDPITKDWVPRFGMGSIKKVEEKYNWMMEEKPKHVEAGLDPFTFKKNEKNLEKEKQNLRELKNKVSAQDQENKESHQKDKILDPMAATVVEATGKLKARSDNDRKDVRTGERKALLKQL